MKIVSKNGTIYQNLTVSIIRDHIYNVKQLLAIVSDDRELKFNDDFTFIDDLTQDELNAGLEAVKEVLINSNETELLKEYFSMFCQASSEDAKLKYAKEFKKDEIDKAKNNAIEGGVSYKDKIFQSAEKDRNLLTSTVSLFAITKQLPEGFVWISKDNEAVPFTLEELIELGGIMANSVNTNTIKARTIKDKVEQAQTLEEIQSIKWDE
ncbi:TPA: DUF4376 domain-containing protein [Campylobacter jejuni]|uniref:DUF4376 domain-containing protein n=1 Tax=Campylobacter jejuni TaxID=197 RepID=UPI0001C275C2|nr:DUF4376 domain-containing protein [Campylobacter jejuni]EDO8477535.1 DUF4376 domain-containing protein [Campylobacter jejuni]EFC30844.1 hypothetical protein C1336_000250106 [Campylobacter jejuni subsp. jejuni 1336]KJD25446.1 hypothetical protein TM01_03890 [Campylobacter jejuni subsp. jejuni]HBK6298815.1 DUF4376 domain-containing protein [Campylobacter jejuni]HEF3189504.1 DUF4376 domain-containing protein [Campylobacter jejuni]